MAWGKSKPQHHSTIGQLFPLIVFLVVLGVAGWVGYQIYLSVNKIQETASQKMGKHDVVFTKDGMRVGVKHVENEKYVDQTQSWVVKAWNLGTQNDGKEIKKKKK